MRTWLSFPLVHGIRAGVSVNPSQKFITRETPWWECLFDTGTKVWYVGGTAIICGMVWWVIETKGHWNEV